MKVNFEELIEEKDRLRHFEQSELLADHLLDEINLFCETNDLLPADIIYILNKLLVNVLVSSNFSLDQASLTIDLLKEKTLEFMKEIQELNDHERK